MFFFLNPISRYFFRFCCSQYLIALITITKIFSLTPPLLMVNLVIITNTIMIIVIAIVIVVIIVIIITIAIITRFSFTYPLFFRLSISP